MRTSDLQAGTYNPFYQTYIDALGEADLLKAMANQMGNFPNFIASLPEDKMNYAYGDDKWTIAEVLQHIIDVERVFQFRALCIARNDKTNLPAFDENAYVPESFANNKSKEDFIEEYKAVRKSTLLLFSAFSEDVLNRVGTASNHPIGVGAMGFILCGHQRHHRNIIRERYL